MPLVSRPVLLVFSVRWIGDLSFCVHTHTHTVGEDLFPVAVAQNFELFFETKCAILFVWSLWCDWSHFLFFKDFSFSALVYVLNFFFIPKCVVADFFML